MVLVGALAGGFRCALRQRQAGCLRGQKPDAAKRLGRLATRISGHDGYGMPEGFFPGDRTFQGASSLRNIGHSGICAKSTENPSKNARLTDQWSLGGTRAPVSSPCATRPPEIGALPAAAPDLHRGDLRLGTLRPGTLRRGTRRRRQHLSAGANDRCRPGACDDARSPHRRC
jgi:hypothetical protein